jgi:hypothetical protein
LRGQSHSLLRFFYHLSLKKKKERKKKSVTFLYLFLNDRALYFLVFFNGRAL